MAVVLRQAFSAVAGQLGLWTQAQEEVDAEAVETPKTAREAATPASERAKRAEIQFDQNVRKVGLVISTAYPGKRGLAEWVPSVASFFFSTRSNMLDHAALLAIAQDARAVLKKEPTLKYVTIPKNGAISILGDTHGYYDDLYTILQAVGMPGPKHFILFNGDLVDRGPKQLQLAALVMLLKVAFPKYVHVTKGNHETSDVNGDEDHDLSFLRTCMDAEKKFAWAAGGGQAVYDQFLEAFEELPLAAVLCDAKANPCVFVCHGGLPSKADTEEGLPLDEIAAWSKTDLNSISEQLFWNDPAPEHDLRWSARKGQGMRMTPNERGGGTYYFGAGVSLRFLEQNGLQLLVRSHEEKAEGFEFEHVKAGRALVCSVFSVPNYEEQKNIGAFLRFPGHALGPDFEVQEEMAIQFKERIQITADVLAELAAKVREADAWEEPRVARKLAFSPSRRSSSRTR